MPIARSESAPPRAGCTPLFAAAAMREADRAATERGRIPSIILMERAGLASADAILARFAAVGRATVVVGTGNNGGDGMVVARHLSEAGWAVAVRSIDGRSPGTPDAATMSAAAAGLGIAIEPLADSAPPGGVVVDALLGTGLAGPPRPAAAASIAWINRADGPVVSLDVPSGVDADTGEAPAEAVRAALTITYHGDLVGLRVAPGRGHAGEVAVVDIGIPSTVTSAPAAWLAGTGAAVRGLRDPDADKYAAGAVLVVGGAPGMAGAPALTAGAALRAGAGLVVIGVPADVAPITAGMLREAMCVGLPDRDGHLAEPALEEIARQARRAGAVAIGPGLGRAPQTGRVVGRLLADLDRPVVLDADGLWHLGGAPEVLTGRSAATVITPHAGEAARLLGWERAEVEARRLAAATELARRCGATVVLKGPGTIVTEREGLPVVNDTGTAALATAGSGDVLTGMIAALLAGGLAGREAALVAVAAHGCAGVAAGRGAGMMAGDLLERIPAVLAGDA